MEQLRWNFAALPDTEQAWKALLTLTKDRHYDVRWRAADAFVYVFPHVTDNEQAWKDLLTLAKDKDSSIRIGAASALGSAFPYFTDKEKASKDLLALTKDEDSSVRIGAASALGSAFPYFTDKEKASKALLALTKDEDSSVRIGAASVLVSAFSHISDKKQAWKALHSLTKDKNNNVRSYVNHSLGRISILKATEAEGDEGFRKELEHALEYFNKSAKEATRYFNPASFCLPFYRSFHAITFKMEEAEVDVKKSIEEAKEAAEGSESKEKLLDAIENLSNALTEAQKPKGFEEIKGDLKAYMRYCNRASDLLGEIEGDAPGATGLIRKGLPIIDQNIKDILAEIKKKTDDFCKETRDTPNEDIGTEIHKIGKELSNVRDPIGLEKSVDNLQMQLSEVCNRMPLENKVEACKLLEKAKNEQFVEDKLNLLNIVIGKVSLIVPVEQTDKTPEPLKKSGLNVTDVKNGCFILIFCSFITAFVFYFIGFQDLNVPNYITILVGLFGISITFYHFIFK